MSTKALRKDFTQGNIARQLVLFSLPFMASNAMQVLYSAIDMVVVGKYVGTFGLSAVSQSSLIVNFATMVCLGFSNAGQVLIAQALGAGKKKEMSRIMGTLFVFVLALSLVLSGIILLLREPILALVNIPDEAHDMALEYLVICTLGLLFTAGYNMVSAVLRGMGDAKRPFMFIAIASVTNLVLDLIFTGWWGWGVAGAAWATIIGQGISFIFSLFYLYRKREAFGFDFSRENFIPDLKYVGMIVKQGVPMAIQSGFINLSMIVVNAQINNLGVVESAAFGVGVRIDDVINKISQGIQYAAMPMVSQNIGAGNQKRAEKVVHWAWVYSVGMTVFFVAMYILFGEELFKLFDPDNPAVHAMSGEFISAILWMFPAFAIMRGSGAFIQGLGHAKLCMVLALLDGVVLRIGLSWLFGIGFGWGFYGFVLGYGLAPYGYAIPSLIYFLSGKWKKRRTLAEEM